jgi:hypothetical protein
MRKNYTMIQLYHYHFSNITIISGIQFIRVSYYKKFPRVENFACICNIEIYISKRRFLIINLNKIIIKLTNFKVVYRICMQI